MYATWTGWDGAVSLLRACVQATGCASHPVMQCCWEGDGLTDLLWAKQKLLLMIAAFCERRNKLFLC